MTSRFLVGMALTAICIILGIQLVDWSATFRAFLSIQPLPLVISATALLAAQVLFAMRWHGLIDSPSLPLFQVFRYMMIGCMANAILPARPGGVIRIFLLRKGRQISLGLGFASTVIERLFDFILLCMLALGISLSIPLPSNVTIGLNFIGSASIGLVIILIILNRNTAWLPEQVKKHTFLQTRAMHTIAEKLMEFSSALDILRSPKKLIRAALISVIGWTLLALSLYSLSVGFQLPSPPEAVLLVLVTTNLGSAVPSSPGALGVYHFLAVMALSLWNVNLNLALAFAICAHALTMITHVTCGIISIWVDKLHFSELRHISGNTDANIK